MAALLSLLNWDRVLGAILGLWISWALFAILNQAIWLPQERERGRQEVRAELIERAMELVKERSRNNAEVKKLDDRSACLELGGVWDNGVCG